MPATRNLIEEHSLTVKTEVWMDWNSNKRRLVCLCLINFSRSKAQIPLHDTVPISAKLTRKQGVVQDDTGMRLELPEVTVKWWWKHVVPADGEPKLGYNFRAVDLQ
jgi:hypothetical protein